MMLRIVKRGVVLRYMDRIVHASSTVTAIKHEMGYILVDTGHKTERSWILHRLKLNGIDPLSISVIIITHMHPDHKGNLELFKNAEIYSHENYEKFNSIFEGISLLSTPGHTLNHISVCVKTDREKVIIAGDAIPTEDNLLKLIPPAIHEDRKLAYRSMKKITHSADYVIPGHGKLIKNPHKI